MKSLAEDEGRQTTTRSGLSSEMAERFMRFRRSAVKSFHTEPDVTRDLSESRLTDNVTDYRPFIISTAEFFGFSSDEEETHPSPQIWCEPMNAAELLDGYEPQGEESKEPFKIG